MGGALIIQLKTELLIEELRTRNRVLGNEIAQMIASGVPTEQVIDQLENRIDDLKRAVAALAVREIGAAINQMSFSSYWDTVVSDPNFEFYRWEYEPTANHCATCTARNGLVGTAEEMRAVGLPGAGTTDCNIGCRCRIVPISAEEYAAGEKIK